MIRQGKACALPYAQKAADLAPDNSSILDTLASALACERQFDMALSTQKRAVELAPESDSLRLNLAAIALKAGDKSLARAELTRLQALGARFKQQVEVERLLKVS
jgi:Flp pilus assembly protein TadD